MGDAVPNAKSVGDLTTNDDFIDANSGVPKFVESSKCFVCNSVNLYNPHQPFY